MHLSSVIPANDTRESVFGHRLGHYRIRNQGYCVRRLISTELHLSVFSAETISSEKMSIDISNTL